MQNKKSIVLIVLGIAAVFSLIYGIVTPSKARRGISRESVGIKRQATVTAEIKAVSGARRAKRTDSSDWGRDPFFSSAIASTAKAITDVRLTGILWDERAPLAMIDDAPVGIGDKVNSYIIVEIHQDRVVLTDGAQNYELRLSH